MGHRKTDRGRTAIAILLSVVSACGGEPGTGGVVADSDAAGEAVERDGLSPAERRAVETADRAYADAWLANDPDSVMGTLTGDAVVVPSGMDAIRGREAIRGFWFPPDGPPTLVRRYSVVQEEIDGSGDLAYVRGTFELAFDYDGASYETSGTYVSLLRHEDEVGWRIARRMWSDRPR